MYCFSPRLTSVHPPSSGSALPIRHTGLERQKMEVHVHRVCRGGQALRDAGDLSAGWHVPPSRLRRRNRRGEEFNRTCVAVFGDTAVTVFGGCCEDPKRPRMKTAQVERTDCCTVRSPGVFCCFLKSTNHCARYRCDRFLGVVDGPGHGWKTAHRSDVPTAVPYS